MRATLRRLPGLVAAVGSGAAAVGLLWRPSEHPVVIATPRGRAAQPAGDGLYRYDTVFTAAGNTAVDAVVLALCILLLATAWPQFRAGSPRGAVLRTGALAPHCCKAPRRLDWTFTPRP
jgi:hypothetical protein